MDREQAAREWLERNTGFRWATEPEDGVDVGILNRRMRMRSRQLADFANEQVQAADSLQHELDWLYSQEQNVELSSFWDAGWRLRLGDVTNGFTDDGRFDSLTEVAEYLRGLRQKENDENRSEPSESE